MGYSWSSGGRRGFGWVVEINYWEGVGVVQSGLKNVWGVYIICEGVSEVD